MTAEWFLIAVLYVLGGLTYVDLCKIAASRRDLTMSFKYHFVGFCLWPVFALRVQIKLMRRKI